MGLPFPASCCILTTSSGRFPEPTRFVALLFLFCARGHSLIHDPRSSRTSTTVRRDIAASWIPFFDDCHIIFLAPVSCFDQALAEDRRVNRVVRLPYLSPLLLFLPVPSRPASRPVSTSPIIISPRRLRCTFSFLGIGPLEYSNDRGATAQ